MHMQDIDERVLALIRAGTGKKAELVAATGQDKAAVGNSLVRLRGQKRIGSQGNTTTLRYHVIETGHEDSSRARGNGTSQRRTLPTPQPAAMGKGDRAKRRPPNTGADDSFGVMIDDRARIGLRLDGQELVLSPAQALRVWSFLDQQELILKDAAKGRAN